MMPQFLKKKLGKLLKWAERYTKTDMTYLIKGSFWLNLSKILSISASLISSVAFANLLPEETYGTFRYILSIAALLTIPTLQGINTAIARAIARNEHVSYTKTINTKMKWGSLGALAGLVIALYYYMSGDNRLALLFLTSSLFIPFMDTFHIYAGILQGEKKFNILARDEIITRMMTSLLIVAVIFSTKNLLLIIITYFLSTTLLRLLFLKLTIKEDTYKDADNAGLIRFGKHLTVMGMFGKIAAQADKILLFQHIGAGALAAYYLAFMPFKQTQTFLNGIPILALPKFSSNSLSLIKKTLPAKMFKMFLCIIPIVVLYWFAAPYIYKILFPQYIDSVFISQLLMLQLFFFPTTLIGTALSAQEKTKELYINSSSFVVIRVLLLVMLIPSYGVYGAVTAIFLAKIIGICILMYMFYKATD